MKIITLSSNLPEDAYAPEHPALTLCRMRGEVVGAIYKAPAKAITDVFFRAREALSSSRVLVIYMDGLGYSLFERVRLPFMKDAFSFEPAYTAYPPLTQPCMASMLTGVWPDEHGIYSRRDHRPRVPSLLAVPGAVLVEADSAPLALEKPPVLTLAQGQESIDAAVLRAALAYVQSDAPLVIAHFHGLDDMEHDVGDDEARLADKLSELDDAACTLCHAFHGTVILCADHGVHRDGQSGSHGAFDYRDMFVPYGEAVF